MVSSSFELPGENLMIDRPFFVLGFSAARKPLRHAVTSSTDYGAKPPAAPMDHPGQGMDYLPPAGPGPMEAD